jgi:hypothetical protein
MAELLTLTSPQTFPSNTTWKVEDIYLSLIGPSIKITVVSNTGERFVWRQVPGPDLTAADILVGLSFINQGKFMVNQGKSLQKWLLDRMSAAGAKVGTVSGTPD